MGLHNLWIVWYFIFLFGNGIAAFIAFWVGLIQGLTKNNWDGAWNDAFHEWQNKIVYDIFYWELISLFWDSMLKWIHINFQYNKVNFIHPFLLTFSSSYNYQLIDVLIICILAHVNK